MIIAMHGLYRRARLGASDSLVLALRADRGVRWAILLFAVGTLGTLYLPFVENALATVFLVSGAVDIF